VIEESLNLDLPETGVEPIFFVAIGVGGAIAARWVDMLPALGMMGLADLILFVIAGIDSIGGDRPILNLPPKMPTNESHVHPVNERRSICLQSKPSRLE
jgi:hypothetical protein